MKNSGASREGLTKVLLTLTAASFLAGLFSSCTGTPEAATTARAQEQAATPTPQAAAAQQSGDAKQREDWRISMAQIPHEKKGCFQGSYPNREWREVPCAPAPDYPQPPRRGPRPLVVGNGDDIAAQAPTGFISTAIGSFDSVTNVTSESGPIGNSGPSIANAYTLQLNTNFFTSTVCSGSPNPGCQGWQQFVFENYGSGARAYIQYWLIRYNAPCPAGQSWNQFSFTGSTDIYCWKNNTGGVVTVPAQPITNLGQLSLSGAVSATGDSVTLSDGPNVYARVGDNAVNAAVGWNVAEFNIFGDGGNSAGGGMASFNSGASVVTRTRIIYGGNAAPICVAQGFTAETNNLSFGPGAPGSSPPGPAVFFNESTAGGASSNCAAATSVGDTHLATVEKLFYDFQASGDYILAQVDPDFVVEARQVSGAPTWPDASVNKAVATRMGKNKVAVCLDPMRVNIDGTAQNLADNATFSTPDGVDVTRRGNVYFITSQSGDSVRAEVNSSWINVTVGFGRWPAKVTGLLANADNDANKLAARDGTVLTNPFSFEDLYRRHGDSWRVSPRESLLSACEGKPVEGGNPKRPFFARDLEPQVYQHARAVCTAAGVKGETFLDACTLDVAVIGDDKAAQVFVTHPVPVAVGTFVGSPGSGLTGGSWLYRWWWLLLLLILLVLLILWLLRRRNNP